MSTTTPSTAPPTPTSSPSGGGGGTQNSPLLFFVALGFGVVFTNLWIIVGVKYCFRYNARNRARAQGVDEVDLQAIGARPHRRRREKKLMTVDEVNERFPVTKYKAWRANREVMGLPAAGGIAPTDGTTPVIQTDLDPPGSPLPKIPEPTADPTKPPAPVVTETPPVTTTPPAAPTQTQQNRTSTEIRRVRSTDGDNDHDQDDDEAMAPVSAEIANSYGDTCAICIDNLEDSDDVRGLTCGHAFHTACLDPWLTSRRACCPLCKADYYVPKPRTEAEIEAEEAARERRRQAAAQVHRHPISAWWYRAESFVNNGGNNDANRRNRTDDRRRQRGPRWNPFSRETPPPNQTAGAAAAAADAAAAAAPPPSQEVRQAPSGGFLSRFSRHSPSNSNSANPAPQEPTPSALEAGLATNTTPATR